MMTELMGAENNKTIAYNAFADDIIIIAQLDNNLQINLEWWGVKLDTGRTKGNKISIDWI